MVRKEAVVQLKSGLDTRPVAMLVQVASKYASETFLETSSKRVNAKSIMGMMTLGLIPGEEVTIVANGGDEEQALGEIEAYLTSV